MVWPTELVQDRAASFQLLLGGPLATSHGDLMLEGGGIRGRGERNQGPGETSGLAFEDMSPLKERTEVT